MFADEDLIMISGLQHLIFCERQFSLIHVEQVWQDNFLTAKGDVFHDKVDNLPSESRPDCRIVRRLRLCSKKLGIYGVADVVEFHPAENGVDMAAYGFSGLWKPFPVEYKRGQPKDDLSDVVQLCAQALCLEEMLGVTMQEGCLFYGQTRKRFPVNLDESLRAATLAAIRRAHALLASGVTPPAHYEAKCKSCSLFDICRPQLPEQKLPRYMKQLFTPEDPS